MELNLLKSCMNSMPVVGFAVCLKADGAFGVEQPTKVEVSYKVVGICILLSVTKVARELKSVL